MTTTNKLLIAGTIGVLGIAFYLKSKKDKSTFTTNEDKPNNTGTTVDNVSNPDVEDIKQPAPTPVKPAPTPIKPYPKPYRPSQEEMEQAERERLAQIRREEVEERKERLKRELESIGNIFPTIGRPRFDTGNRDGSISSGRGGTTRNTNMPEQIYMPESPTRGRDVQLSSTRRDRSPVSSRVRPRRVRDTGVLNRGNTGMMRFTGDASDVDLLNLQIH